jgi:hypothetical protein
MIRSGGIMIRSEHEPRELNIIDTVRPDAQYDTIRHDTTRSDPIHERLAYNTIHTCTANPAQYIRAAVHIVFPQGVQYGTIRTTRMPVANREILLMICEIFFYARGFSRYDTRFVLYFLGV